jgi:multicomponent Na+:H+ antiporter subunit D
MNIPVYIIFIPVISAITIYLINNRYISYLVFVVQAFITLLLFNYGNFILKNDTHRIFLGGWEAGVGISLRNDRLSLAFLILAVFMWWNIIIYSWKSRKNDTRYWFFLMFLQGTFFGIIQSNDLFNIFVFIEVVTTISAILIIYKRDGFSLRAGLYYLLFNSVGMIIYLIGIGLLYNTFGTLNIDQLRDLIFALEDTNVIRFAYAFIIAALGVKSAFFPVYNWLPKAHGAAPSAISALLSGLLVKSGLYVFIRINQIMPMTSMQNYFYILGFLTALGGIIFALSQNDIKQILAFSTVSQVGLILMGLSAMSGEAMQGAIFHMLNHGLFKSMLFMGAGNIINFYGTRSVNDIRGVFKTMPLTSIFMLGGVLAITGAPMFNGFVSKALIQYSFKENILVTLMFYILNVGTILYYIKFVQIFFGRSSASISEDKPSVLPLALSMIGCLLLGTFLLPVIESIGGIQIFTINLFSISKIFSYFLYVGIAVVIYNKLVKKYDSLFNSIRHFNIPFETSNMMLIIFVISMLIVL